MRLLARVCTETSRPVTREEWEEALGLCRDEQSAREIGELLEHLLAEEWRGSYHVTREGMALLRRGGLKDIEAHDTWALGDNGHNGPLYGNSARQVSQLDEVLPLGYGDKLVPVTDQRFALVGAQPGDVLVFRFTGRVEPGDVRLVYGSAGDVMGLERVLESDALVHELLLVAHIRRMT